MLTDMLSEAVRKNPGKTAIVQGARRVRYDELDELAGRTAAGLRRLGVSPGECVAVVLPNSAEFVAALFACARLGAIMLPLNPQYTQEELRRYLADAPARLAIVAAATGDLLAGTGVFVSEFGALLHDPPLPKPADRFGGRALYLYTSGSTDSSKRLCCTQENLVYEAINFVETVGLTAEDNVLCTIPLYHSYGLGNCLLDAVYTGSTLVLLDRNDAPFAAEAQRIFELIRAEKVTFYPGVPYQFQILASLPDSFGNPLAGLSLCVSSGDVLPRQTHERFLKRYGLPIRSLYGSTEAGSICLHTDPAELMQFGSLGPPLKNVAIRIRDDSGQDLPVNQSGRIWVKSPVIPPTGYENRPELTAQTFRDGFYDTGDLGKLDSRGNLIMTGRKQTFADVGGHKVDVSEVEEVLQSHPRVREAAAVGVEAGNLGTVIKAVVVADGGCDEALILAHCRQRLAAFKVPRLVEFRDALPRSPIGKVLKSELVGDRAFLTDSVRREPALPNVDSLAEQIREQAALCLQHEPTSLARSASFQSMGFDSLRATELHLRLVKLTGLPLSISVLWNYPSIDELAAAIWDEMNAKSKGNEQLGGPTNISPVGKSFDEILGEVESLSEREVDAAFGGG
jgi:long-chain acyl-CoA synthetase